jgi:hypothetical protein
VANLINEYRRRHGLNFVLPLDEGLCYFDLAKKPGAIVLTSSPSRSITTCRQCLKHQQVLVAELFIHTGLVAPDPVFKQVAHEHIHPDTDLRTWVNEKIGDPKKVYEPVEATDDRDVEVWLWRFFTRHNPIFNRKWTNKEEPFRSLEQISWVIDKYGKHSNYPALFEFFYKNLYYTFTLGRKYLLYK